MNRIRFQRARRMFLAALLFYCCGGTVIGTVASGGSGDPADQEAPAGMDEATIKKMMDLATPGEHHKRLDRYAGSWNTTVKMWMGDGEPTIATGSVIYSWLLGGRYLQSRHTGQFAGMPFEGVGIDGYDNAQRRYFSIWLDNMGTGVMTLTGQPSADGEGIDYWGTTFDATTMKEVKVREEVRWVDDKKYTFTMFMEMPGPDGKMQEARVMEITAVRQ